MALYQVICPVCGTQEIFRHGCTGCESPRCPQCGRPAHRDWSASCGLRPFVSYWTDALSTDPDRPVFIDSREKEQRLSQKFGFQRVK